MKVKSYIMSCDPKRVDKTNYLTDVHEFLNVQTNSPIDYMNPTFIIGTDPDTMEQIKKSNYLYVERWKRYYFIDDYTFETGSRLLIKCHCDVLNTFKDDILKTTCTVDRNEKKCNGYIIDTEFTKLAYKQYVTKKFPYGFDKESIILMTVG